RTGLVVRTAEDDPMSADPAIRRKGIDATCRALDCCAAVGATHLVGPLHSALGTFSGAGATEEEWKRSVDSVRKMAEHAGSINVTLAIEPLNRFETYLLTTHADADRFVAEVDHPACGVMYDTFHANIEEKSMGQAIRDCAA